MLRTAFALIVLAGCTSEPPPLDDWRGQYTVEASTCAFLDSALDATPIVRLHERDAGGIALYTFNGPDAWVEIDGISLTADGAGRLTGTGVTLLCGDPCGSCNREIRYARDDVGRTSSSAIWIELARASQDATDATCTDANAWALGASAVTCTIDAAYYAADRN